MLHVYFLIHRRYNQLPLIITKGRGVNGRHRPFMGQFNIELRFDKYFNEVDGMYGLLYFTQSHYVH